MAVALLTKAVTESLRPRATDVGDTVPLLVNVGLIGVAVATGVLVGCVVGVRVGVAVLVGLFVGVLVGVLVGTSAGVLVGCAAATLTEPAEPFQLNSCVQPGVNTRHPGCTPLSQRLPGLARSR